MLILFVIGPCATIQVEFASSANDLRRKQSGVPGTYTLRQGKSTNGKPDWISSDGKYAIWWMNLYGGKWYIAEVVHRGANIADLLSPAGYSSPDQGMKWQWYDHTAKWMPATDDISVICSNGK